MKTFPRTLVLHYKGAIQQKKKKKQDSNTTHYVIRRDCNKNNKYLEMSEKLETTFAQFMKAHLHI